MSVMNDNNEHEYRLVAGKGPVSCGFCVGSNDDEWGQLG